MPLTFWRDENDVDVRERLNKSVMNVEAVRKYQRLMCLKMWRDATLVDARHLSVWEVDGDHFALPCRLFCRQHSKPFEFGLAPRLAAFVQPHRHVHAAVP